MNQFDHVFHLFVFLQKSPTTLSSKLLVTLPENLPLVTRLWPQLETTWSWNALLLEATLQPG